MKKSLLYSLIIISVLTIMGLISLQNGKIGVTDLNAYDPAYFACAYVNPYWINYGPNLVNAMDAGGPNSCAVTATFPKGPPSDSYSDYVAWKGRAPFPVPTPRIYVNANDSASPLGGSFGINYIKVTWTGTALGCEQSMYLPWTMFENVGSDIGDTFNSRGDWSMYGYIRFSTYCNETINLGGTSGDGSLSQTASIYDGAVTRTVGPVQLRTQWSENFVYHVTASLNFLANTYDKTNTWNARYFSVSNVAEFIINAVGTDYTQWNSPNNQIAMYYDYLTLGAADAVPAYGSPPGMLVGTARGVQPVEGAWVHWSPAPQPTVTPAMPVTGYHVFRSEGVTKSGHPYTELGIFPNTVTSVVDTICPGGNTYCYKVLVLNNGPTGTYLGDQHNTINATYHESLLDDVPEVCGWVDVAPSPTPTFTATWDMSLTPPTPMPTATATEVNGPITDAHVYPNPFNPNAGSRKFYVNNVQSGTKVKIFAMDGALVKDGDVFGTFEWDGKNKNGARVVSGLYYLVLEDPNGATDVKRIIICYKCDPVYKP